MGRKKKDPGAGLMSEARAADAKRLALYEGLKTPDQDLIEERIRLAADQIPELAGLLEAEELDTPEEIQEDPRLAELKMQALESLSERGKAGLSEEDKLKYDDTRMAMAADAASQQADIERRMAEKGAGGSGQELAMRIAGQQGQAQRASELGRGMAADALQAKMQSEQAAGAMAGQMSAQDMARQQQNEAAKRQIAQFNAANRMNAQRQNLSTQQNIANQRAAQQGNMYTNLANSQNQQFQNELNRANAIGGVYGGQSTSLRSQAAQARANQGSGGSLLGTIGTVGGAVVGGIYGGPMGASMGSQIGGAAGQGIGSQMGYAADGAVVDKDFNSLSPEELQTIQDINSQVDARDNSAHYPEEEGSEFSYASREALENALRRQEALDAGYADGGVPGYIAEDGATISVDGGFIFPGEEDEYAGDRVDAKVNRGEMILNAEQQQRMLDVLRGEQSPEILKNGEDVVETPEAAQNRGFLKVLEMIGKK